MARVIKNVEKTQIGNRLQEDRKNPKCRRALDEKGIYAFLAIRIARLGKREKIT